MDGKKNDCPVSSRYVTHPRGWKVVACFTVAECTRSSALECICQRYTSVRPERRSRTSYTVSNTWLMTSYRTIRGPSLRYSAEGRVPLKYQPSPVAQLRGSDVSKSGPTLRVSPVVL